MAVDKLWLKGAEAVLAEIAGATLQTNKSAKGKLLDAVIAKGAGGAGVAGVTGLVSMLGSASTGTAIGALSGAAATSAKLFWIGSLIGGGVAAGTGILAVGGIIAGLGAARYWRGKPRSVEDLEEHEREILSVVELLIPALREEAAKTRPLTEAETTAVKTIWEDLTASVDIYVSNDASRRLAHKHKLRMKKALYKLRELLKEIRQ